MPYYHVPQTLQGQRMDALLEPPHFYLTMSLSCNIGYQHCRNWLHMHSVYSGLRAEAARADVAYF